MPINLSSPIQPTWCPGCGNFAIFGALKLALNNLKLEPQQLAFTYDVGCAGNMADFLLANGFHGLHGRALPLAAGIKLGNHQLKVFSVIGDGGCFGEGVGHFLNLCRGNHDLVVLAHNNFLYSLTTGQKSPTTPKGTITPSSLQGVIEEPFNPLASALINQATFVAQGFAANIPHLTKLIEQATAHVGFSFINILQPCPTFNKFQPISWYQEHVYDLAKENYQPSNLTAALQKSLETDRLPIGILYQSQRPAFHQNFPAIAKKTLSELPIDKIDLSSALADFS